MTKVYCPVDKLDAELDEYNKRELHNAKNKNILSILI